jgi:molybdenum cofactor cytidylyltransferase
LQSDAFYRGMLGSQKTDAALPLARLCSTRPCARGARAHPWPRGIAHRRYLAAGNCRFGYRRIDRRPARRRAVTIAAVMFGLVPLGQACGGILAHSLTAGDQVLKKGTLLDKRSCQLLRDAGYTQVTVARLQTGDVPEGEAAARLGQSLLAAGLCRSDAVHGRVDILAICNGLLRVDSGAVERFNFTDEAITLATLADRSIVTKGDMVATLKIIPFAVNESGIEAAQAVITGENRVFSVKPFQHLAVGLVLTDLPHLKSTVLTKTIAAIQARVQARGGTLLPPLRTAHETGALTAALQSLMDNADLLLISGASAVTDRQDVAPRAIVAAGGEITRFGMPVDPGNLICFGKISGKHTIILPGCSRSPSANGVDWVLDRIFAGEDVGKREIAGMGAGGLLRDGETRPVPARLTPRR